MQKVLDIRLGLHQTELQLAVDRNNSANAWFTCRAVAGAVKGSRILFQNAPKAHPSMCEFRSKYDKPAIEGGWGAQSHSLQEIAETEPDFSHIICHENDINVAHFKNTLLVACIIPKIANRSLMVSRLMRPGGFC